MAGAAAYLVPRFGVSAPEPETWWVTPSAVRWEGGDTSIDWAGGDYSTMTLRGEYDLIPGHTYRLVLEPTGLQRTFNVLSLREIRHQ